MKYLYSFLLVIFLSSCAQNNNLEINEQEINKNKDLFLVINTFYSKLSGVDFNPINQEEILVISDNKKSIDLINIKSNEIKRTFTGFILENEIGNINSFVHISQKDLLVVGGHFQSNANIRVYDFQTGQIKFNLSDAKEEIKKILFSDDKKYLIAISDFNIYIWDINSFKLMNEIKTVNKIKNIDSFFTNNQNNISIIDDKNNFSIYDISGKNLGDITFNKSIDKSKFYKDRFVLISKENNPEIIVLNKDLSLKNILLLIDSTKNFTAEYLSKKDNFLLKDIVGIYSLNKNDMTTNLMIESFRPSLLQNIEIFENKLKILTKKFDFVTIDLDTLNLEQTLNYEKFKPSSFKISDKNIYLQNKQAEIIIIKENEKLEDLKNIDIKKKIEKILDENISLLGEKYLDLKISNEIDSGYAFSSSSLDSLKLMASTNMIFNDKENQNIKKKDELFLFKDSRFTKSIKFDEFDSFGFLDNEILIGFKKGYLGSFGLDGKLNYKFSKNSNSIKNIYSSNSYIISQDIRNVINVYNKTSKKYLLSIFFDFEGNYVLWIDEGYFTVSNDKALDYINWHLNNKNDENAQRYSIEKFYDVFFRPDLVKLKLQGKNISEFTNGLTYQDALKNPPPKVDILKVENQNVTVRKDKNDDINLSNDKTTITFNVRDNNGGVGLIRVYQEGKLIKTFGNGKINKQAANIDTISEQENINEKVKLAQNEYLEKMKNSVTKGINETISLEDSIADVITSNIQNKAGEYNIDLDLISGKNEITIEAFNSSNTISSYKESINIISNITKKEPTLYAIVTGVNEFELNYVSNLKYSQNDAQAIKETIEKEKGKSYRNVEIKYLIGKDLTKENLNNAIEEIKQKANLEDTLVFYISTHGKNYKGKLMLVPQNNKSVKNFISFEDLFKNMQSVKTLKQIFILDTCESGSANDIVSSIYDSKASVLAKSSGVHMLLATTKGTFAFEHPNPNIKHGVFTNNILTALKDKNTDKNKDRTISVIELSKMLQEPKYIVDRQYPIIRNVGNDVKVRDLK